MKADPHYVIKNVHTGHFFCESKHNFCTNIKYAKTFTHKEAVIKQKELKEIFECEIVESTEIN